jgi:hypothetical protein
MTLTVLIVERIEPACRLGDGRPSYVGTGPRKYPNGLDQAVQVIDVMDSDCPIIVHRIKKLTIYWCLRRCSVKTYRSACQEEEEEPVQSHCAKTVRNPTHLACRRRRPHPRPGCGFYGNSPNNRRKSFIALATSKIPPRAGPIAVMLLGAEHQPS